MKKKIDFSGFQCLLILLSVFDVGDRQVMNGATNVTLQAIANVIVQSLNDLADNGISVPSAPGQPVPWWLNNTLNNIAFYSHFPVYVFCDVW